MNIQKSDQIVGRFRTMGWTPVREKYEWSRTLEAKPEDVFPLLCPAREADWIPGWEADLVFTESGYAEVGCVFQTDGSGSVGPGVWVFSRHDPPHGAEIVRFTPDVLFQLSIDLAPEGEGRTVARWAYVLTSLTGEGVAEVGRVMAGMEAKATILNRALEHYLATGQMLSMDP